MTSVDPSRALDDEVAGCAAAHQALLRTLDDARDRPNVDPGTASVLPNWTIGHVLTHLARNADALRAMFDGAAAGEVRPMYPSAEQREADINAGAGRKLGELVSDVRTSIWALEGAWAQLDAEGWKGHGLTRVGKVPVAEFPKLRWREVEVHHADLGLSAFTPAHWSNQFVAMDLKRRLTEWQADGSSFPDEVAAARPWQQLAWLLGRPSGLETAPPKWV